MLVATLFKEPQMIRAVLGILFSLLFIVFFAPPALAKDSSAAASSKKQSAKKFAGSRRRAKSVVAIKKRRTAAHRPAKISARSRGKVVKKIVVVRGKRNVVYRRVALAPFIHPSHAVLSAGDKAGLNRTDDPLNLRSNAALVLDQSSSKVLFEKNSDVPLPIASLSKLMTSLVVVEAHQDMDEVLTVTEDDIDHLKHTHSRLPIGARLTRAKMLHIALMSSENRAASALGRNYPGGLPAFVAAMNAKAKALGMMDTHYVEPTGLSSQNVSSASDLAKLVIAAHEHPIIREYTTNTDYQVDTGGPVLQYRNSNRLIANPTWEIGLQKTGYIIEAGRCMVMQAIIEGRSIVMIFLDSKGKYSRGADAGSIRKWLEEVKMPAMTHTASAAQG